MFLLYASDRSQSQIMLQQLVVLAHDTTQQKDFLKIFAKEELNWKPILLEALCIVQAKRVVRKLGLDYSELEQRYLPTNPWHPLNIHQIVRLLYHICEELTVDESRKLISFMTEKYSKLKSFVFNDNGEHLEMYMMHWLSEGVINVGSNEGDGISCDLDPIIEYLKLNDIHSLKDTVTNITNEFNGNKTKIEDPIILRGTKTDDRRSTALQETSSNFQSLHISNNSPRYNVRKKTAGHILIINQRNFYLDPNPDLKEVLSPRRLETRHGTDRDVESLKETFGAFGYTHHVERNLTHLQILPAVKKAVEESTRLDSLIVCILSHGSKGSVYSHNSVKVEIEDIEKVMISDQLIGKPKVLIIQACQGELTQKAKQIDTGRLCHDGPTMSLPAYSDLIRCGSTVPGHTSFRHTEDGSWYIQTLCKTLNEFAER